MIGQISFNRNTGFPLENGPSIWHILLNTDNTHKVQTIQEVFKMFSLDRHDEHIAVQKRL